MVAKLSHKISLHLIKSNAIKQEEQDVYAYGIQLLLLSVLDWGITFFLMLLTKKIALSCVYFLVFISLRHQCGGYHAKTHLRCNIAFNLVYLASLSLATLLPGQQYLLLLVIGEFANFWILVQFAPIVHENKPIGEKQLQRHKRTGRLLNVVFTGLAIIFACLGQTSYGWMVLLGQLSVSIAIILEKEKHKKKGRCQV